MSCRYALAVVFLAAGLLARLSPGAEGLDFPLQAESRIEFASLEQARGLLGTADAFTAALSRFDKQSRLQTGEEVSDPQYLKFAASHAKAWDREEVEQLTPILAGVARKLTPWRPLFPDRVLLIKTSGEEEGNAAYTRGAAVILPASMLKRSAEAMERLLLHELFHVASRHQPELRDRLYRVVGFERCGPVETPDSLKDRRLTNPDAPITEHCITLSEGDQTWIGAPILLASVDEYDAKKKGSFFRYLQFRMLAMEQTGDAWRVRTQDGEPVLFDPAKMTAYEEKIGQNTRYIIHPDEILADNFVLVMQEAKQVKTPRILEEMRKILRKP